MTSQLSLRCASLIANVYSNDGDACDSCCGEPSETDAAKHARAMKKAEDSLCTPAARHPVGRQPRNLRVLEQQWACASAAFVRFPPVALAVAPSQHASCIESSRAPRPGLVAAPVKARRATRPGGDRRRPDNPPAAA
jgi:hypothetical protein